MKKISYVMFLFIMMFSLNLTINAAASLSVSKNSVTVGSTFKTSVNLSGVAAWEVHVTSNGPAKDCTINAADGTEDAQNGSKSYSVTCTTTGTGTVTIKLSGNTTTASGTYQNISDTKTVSVIKKTSSSGSSNSTNSSGSSSTSTKLSSINNLKDLKVGEYSLVPNFDISTTSYNIIVPNNIEIINIEAEAEHDKATIAGTGEKNVSEGMNVFEVIVTAENGAKKTYTLNIEVEENPIIVNMDKQDYSIIKKEEILPQVSSLYSLTKVKYNYVVAGEKIEYELPAYYSEITKYTLLGLKDEKGNIELYIYDEKTSKFTLYKEYNFGNIVLYKIETPEEKILDDMIKTKVNINGEELESYQFTKDSDYYLLYGINVNTGNEGWFMYDNKENTLQRYDIDDISKLIDKNNKFILVVLMLSVVCFLMLTFLLIFINKSTKEKN